MPPRPWSDKIDAALKSTLGPTTVLVTIDREGKSIVRFFNETGSQMCFGEGATAAEAVDDCLAKRPEVLPQEER